MYNFNRRYVLKKIETFIWKLFGLITVIGMTSVIISCTGPEGPSGTPGANGRDANIICAVCHGDEADNIELKFNQYDLSKHNTGTIYEEEAGRLQCGGCHTGDGYAEAAGLNQNDPVSKASSKINCRACHFIHKNFDTTDFARRVTQGFALRHTGAMIDQKEGNLCSKCHQARPYTHSSTADTIKPASKGASYSRFGPHYGVVANVVTENGLYKINGPEPYPTEANKHMALPKGCVSCHMGKDTLNPAVGGHTFLTPVANLANFKNNCADPCHDVSKMKSHPLYNAIRDSLVVYRQLLINKGWLDTTQALQETGYNVLGEYPRTAGGQNLILQPTEAEVLLNYLYIAKDRSNGVHNPGYVKALVWNGLAFLRQ
ncbi:MAG: hypothetical protein EPN82_03665 [Bacteroidetes bacterium]|nr:MAG: hypothetical protein EPN82_03665 [Bacteroidota bacterium]